MAIASQWASKARLLSGYLDAQPRVLTRAAAIGQWGRRALEATVAAGDVIRILPGVYCGARHRDEPVAWGLALNAWHPAGIVTGPLALHLMNPRLALPESASIRVSPGLRPRIPVGVSCVQGTVTPARALARGVRTATPAVALVDAWRFTPAPMRSHLFYEALWAGVIAPGLVLPEVEASTRLPGRAALLRLVRACEEGITSPLERIAKEETFVGALFAEFEWQATVDLGHRRVRPDMLHRAAKLIVELDGARYHGSPQAREADRERDVDLAAAGFVTLRFTWRDLTKRPAWCRARVREVMRVRSRSPDTRT
ncbi:endonuclease domain-containing protein [Demequina sp. B12]|uniref:endonuclease domain-containing protein n=1 Tax=Demequina sp. B12 TaxID=2992757 RepID=UPI00237BFF88|nr:DUF559 domain-containing protein [Demequina sp. B12]MDE0572516.1 endonuclease domain-containing protein [Demequina sp. B12]